MAERFKLETKDGKDAGKVFLWSAGAAIVAVLIDLIPNVNFPGGVVVLVPIVNTILVALKRFLEDKRY